MSSSSLSSEEASATASFETRRGLTLPAVPPFEPLLSFEVLGARGGADPGDDEELLDPFEPGEALGLPEPGDEVRPPFGF
jgi:hypothetical protein